MHGASRHALSSASDDEVGGSKRAMREQLQNKLRASGNRAPPHGGGASRHALIVCEGRRRRRTHRAIARAAPKQATSVSGNRAPPHGGGASRHALSSARDDDGGGLTARLREQLQ